jgi:hypothetical protein
MNTLKQSEQAPVPVNQPTGWPSFYLIPETITIPSQPAASNDPAYHPPALTKLKPPPETRIERFIRIEKEIFQEACADAWTALKQAGSDTVRWFARWVILPMSVACALSMHLVSPAELPM